MWDYVVTTYIDVCFDLKLHAFMFTPYLGMGRVDRMNAGRGRTEVSLRYRWMISDDLMA